MESRDWLEWDRQSMRMYIFGYGVDKACMNKKSLKYVCE